MRRIELLLSDLNIEYKHPDGQWKSFGEVWTELAVAWGKYDQSEQQEIIYALEDTLNQDNK